jgi:uncharacterized protein YdeI (BOF family)
MKSILRSLTLGCFAAVLACSLAWGLPRAGFSTSMPQAQDQQQPAQSQTFTGTITKAGDSYVLRDSSGTVYKLDDSSKAQSFEGKQVKVTGKLDTDSKTIHVDSIEGAAS